MKQVKVKKIKKLPKYNLGTPDVPPVDTRQTGNAGTSVLGTLYGSYTPQLGASFPQLDVSSAGAAKGVGTSGTDFATSATPYMNAIGTGFDLINVATSGQKPTVASAAGSALKGASAGMAFGPVGAAIGAAAGLLAGTAGGRAKFDPSKLSATGDIANAVSKNTGWIGGLFGADRNKLLRDAAQWQNSLAATEMTANARNAWASDPRNQPVAQTVKNGGVIIGDPSKGLTRAQLDSREVVTDKHGNNAVRLPYAEGTDSIPAFIQPTYKVFSEDRHYADIAEKIIKGTKEGSRLRELEINKLAMIQELTKPKNSTDYKVLHANGGVNNVKSSDDLSWDSDMQDFVLAMLGGINQYTLGRYNELQNEYANLGFGDEKPGKTIKKADNVKAYQEKYNKLTYGNNAIQRLLDEGRIKAKGNTGDRATTWADGLPGTMTWLRHFGKNLSKDQLAKMNTILKSSGVEAFTNTKNGMVNFRPIQQKATVNNQPIEMEEEIVDEIPLPVKTKKNISLDKFGQFADYIGDRLPLMMAYANKPEWDIESPSTWIPKYVPVAVDKSNQIRAVKDVMNTSNYNIRNINPSTGAYMQYASNLASQIANQYSNIYTDQTNEQYARIAQNADIHNQWAPQNAAAMYKAKADTQANKAAAYAQKDTRINDAWQYLRDEQVKPFMQQYLSSGAYNKYIQNLT